MVIGILSDTHDQLDRIDAIVEYLKKRKVRHVLHAGDFIAPFSVKRLAKLGCPVTAVYGNNDGERAGIAKAFGDWGEVHERMVKLELGGRRVAMMHEPDFVEEAAESGRWNVVIYGHSHDPEIRAVGECLVINPGGGGGVPDGDSTCVLLDLATMKGKIKKL